MGIKKAMPRRTFVSGMGRILMLPLLDAMIPSRGEAAVTPKRFFAFYIPNGSYMGDKLTGRAQGFWNPGADFSTQPPLALMNIKQHAQELLIIRNLHNSSGYINNVNFPNYQNFPTPAGVDTDGSDYILPFAHGQTGASFLTCSSGQRDTNGRFLNVIMPHDSLDQILLKKWRQQDSWQGKSFLVSNTTATNAPRTDVTAKAYGQTVSYVDTAPVFPMFDATSVLDSFFRASGGGAALTEGRKIYNRSHLDFMLDGIASLKRELGNTDRRVLSQYLEEVRELEKTAAELNSNAGTTCTRPTGAPTSSPTFDDAIATAHYVNFGRFAVQAAILGMKCDVVRAGAMMFGTESSQLNFKNVITGNMIYQNANMNASYHLEIAHHANNEENLKKLVSIHHLQMSFFGDMLQALKNQDEGSGKMIDNTILMTGLGFGDGNRHSRNDLVRVIAGGANFGIRRGGRAIDANHAEVASLYLGILKAMGITLTEYGKGQGRATIAMNLG